MSRTLRVALGGRGYPVVVGRGALRGVGRRLRRTLGTRSVIVVSAAPVWRHHGRALAHALQAAGVRMRRLLVPDGERAKTLAVLGRLLRAMARLRADRDAVVVAFGGGTVGDVAGLAAALYARGVRIVQVPTTLEAQVDAAIGGKTAVDLPEGKNLVGAFHQPSLVLADPEVLRTLPGRQVRAGLAEVVKYGVIASPALFGWIERHAREILRGDPGALEHLVVASAAIKARVVGRDERDAGLRMTLNFGHTLGHALEAAGGFRRLLHGEAVAIGMVAAARVSARLGLCAAAVPVRLERLLSRLGLPVAPPRWAAPGRLRAALALDKKRSRGRLRVVLTRSIGDVTVKAGFHPDLMLRALSRA